MICCCRRGRLRSICTGRWPACATCCATIRPRSARRWPGRKPRPSATKTSRPAAPSASTVSPSCASAAEQERRQRGSTCSPIATPDGSPRVDWGTALAPIYMAHDAGIPVHVWVDETRPRNQGACSPPTNWARTACRTPSSPTMPAAIHAARARSISASSAPIASPRNGDVGNKIGTYLKALAAKDNAVPFYVALPSSTIDWSLRRRPRNPDRGTLCRRAY